MSVSRLGVAGVLAAAVASASIGASGLSAQAAPLLSVEGRSLDVAADRVDLDAETGLASLNGSVVARIGDVELRSDHVELRYDRAPRVSWARGTGSVFARVKGVEATAAAVEFDAASNTIVMTGAVRLSRGKGWMTADRATFSLSTGRVSLDTVKGSIPVQAGALAHP